MPLEESFHYLLLGLSLVSIVLTSGVVWRVEKRLDTSAKLLLAANILFAVGIFFDLLKFYNLLPGWDWDKLVKAMFLVFFTLGMYEMRALVIDLEHADESDGKQRPVMRR
ncbi:MAG: hypothetical protein PHI63_03995 [Patescibacteria group bacterium]|nr:hypothetical protein [Patescibacteria group bacterium]